jgi:hypothetical protein
LRYFHLEIETLVVIQFLCVRIVWRSGREGEPCFFATCSLRF